MEENRQEFRNKETKNDDKKEFYSLNLTPEEIFLIFILFIIFISILIMIFAFIISSSSKKSVHELENQSEYVFSTNNDTTTDSVNSVKNDKINSLDISTNNSQNIDTNQQKQNESINQSNSLQNNQVNETPIKTETKPNLNIKNETIYSSSMIKEEPKSTNTTKTTTSSTETQTKKTTTNTTSIVKPISNSGTTTTQKQTTSLVTKYIIQIASYSTKKQAEDVSQYYTKMGYTAYIRDFSKDGKTYYRLRIGPYDDKKTCEAALTKIKPTIYGKDAFISEGKFPK